MINDSDWLQNGGRLMLGAFVPAGTMVQVEGEVHEVGDGAVTVRMVGQVPEAFYTLLGSKFPIAVASADAAGHAVTVGVVTEVADNIVGISLDPPETVADRRGGLRRDTEVCYAWRTLGYLDAEALEASWKRECGRTRDEEVSAERLDGSYRIVGWRGRAAMSALPVNLGQSGVRFLVAEPLPVDSYVLFYLFLPLSEQRAFPAIAKVVRCEQIADEPYLGENEPGDTFGTGLGPLYKTAIFFEKITVQAQLLLGFYLDALKKGGDAASTK